LQLIENDVRTFLNPLSRIRRFLRGPLIVYQ
jgi:hypothetical protein